MNKLIVACWMLVSAVQAQPTSETNLRQSYQMRNEMASRSILKDYPARNIGPTVQGGRVVDIEGNAKDPKIFYVAYASGGIFKTVNNGITFEPVFDNLDAMTIGDMGLSPSDPNVLYVGTGEKNSSRSSYAGSGIYKTTDGGKSWLALGLAGTHHIGRVVVHPTDPNTVWVAAVGALYSPNPDRGVFKSTDGGKTWRKTLFVNDSTGIIDLAVNPRNPRQLFAAAWERERKAWHFKGNGPGSGIYHSDDGGDTWVRSAEGFPDGAQIGRIGLEISASNPNVVYAIVDNQAEVEDDKKQPEKDPTALKIENFRNMTKEQVLGLDDAKLNAFLKDNGFPRKYDAARVKKDIREDRYGPKAISDYFGADDDANANLFNTKILGAEVYRSDDSGATWKKMNSYDLDGVFYTYGYYFSEIKVAPDDPNLIYLYGVPLLKSRDGGVTWHRLDTLSGVRDVHVDHHSMWIDPSDSKHVLLGNDGGLYQSYDEGATWLHINNTSVGQFYTVNVDMEKPYNVYGGLQDNGVLRGSSQSVPNESPHWESIFGGDGMFVAPDPRNSNLVYTGFQFGNYFRLELDKEKRSRITPRHDIGEAPYRWNWRTPLILSRHNPDIVYMAANKVFRSLNKGETWDVISGDLTHNLKQGNVPFSTISCLAESPIKFGLLYAGTDDGNLWVSTDGGGGWTAINAGLPAGKWVSSVSPSQINEATVFVSLNGYRDDDFMTYIWMSDDFGKTWKDIKGNLPESIANVIIQDNVNENLLYCGLDNGTYVSFDRGTSWYLLNAALNVPAYDMMVHPRDHELVVGTHGRSVFVCDVKPLRQVAENAGKKSILAFTPEDIRYSDRWGEQSFPWSKPFVPSQSILYYVSPSSASGEVTVEILDEKKKLVRKLTAPKANGFGTFTWDVKVEDTAAASSKGKKKAPATASLKYAGKGKYTVRFGFGEHSSEVGFEIK